MIITWIIKCDYCQKKINGLNTGFYEEMNAYNKHLCQKC